MSISHVTKFKKEWAGFTAKKRDMAVYSSFTFISAFFQLRFSKMCYPVPVEHNEKGCDEILMDYRHEWKHEITGSDMIAIRQRLRAVAKPDAHGAGGRYFIRSLYFDDPADTALREKVNGVSRREKFRIRYYDRDTSLIHLEKKSKWNGLGQKQSASLTAAEAQAIVDGRLDQLPRGLHPLVWELCYKMRTRLLRPRTIVDYTREAYVFAPGNVRVTLDFDIRTGLDCTDFLNADCVTVPAGNAPMILEVKWDAFLPDIIRDAVQLEGRHSAAFSKYAACRVYG